VAARSEEVGVSPEDAARRRTAPEGAATSAELAAIAGEPHAAEAAPLRTEAPQTIERTTPETTAAQPDGPTGRDTASPTAAAREPAIRPAPTIPRRPRDAEPTTPPPRRRGRAVAAAVALLAAASAAAVLLPRAFDDPQRSAAPAPTTAPASPTAAPNSPGTSRPNGASRPSASPTAGATATTARATATPGARRPTVPAGFTRYTDPSDGFSLAIPAGWEPSRNGSLVDFDDPTSGRFLRIDTTDTPQADPYENWVSYERQFSRTHSGYTNLGIRRVDYGQDRGWETADWEFRLGSTHVLDRNILVSPRRAHAIYWSTPESLWATPESRRIFDTAAATFEPAPVD
jgi:eukaryotic-like serine/threonine-protein kinase